MRLCWALKSVQDLDSQRMTLSRENTNVENFREGNGTRLMMAQCGDLPWERVGVPCRRVGKVRRRPAGKGKF